MRKGKFFLRGDYSSWLEGPFSEDDVVGKAVMCYRGGRNYDLSRGWFRLAGVIWARLFPINNLAIRLLISLKHTFKKLLKGVCVFK